MNAAVNTDSVRRELSTVVVQAVGKWSISTKLQVLGDKFYQGKVSNVRINVNASVTLLCYIEAKSIKTRI